MAALLGEYEYEYSGVSFYHSGARCKKKETYGRPTNLGWLLPRAVWNLLIGEEGWTEQESKQTSGTGATCRILQGSNHISGHRQQWRQAGWPTASQQVRLKRGNLCTARYSEFEF